MWTPDEFGKGSVARSQTLFVLAWFHAIIQERRKYIPQVFIVFLKKRKIFSLGLDKIL
jgi:dynein heavy chain 2